MPIKALIFLILITIPTTSFAYTLNLGIFRANDSRDVIESGYYGVVGAILWGDRYFRYGAGFLKGVQKVNNNTAGYETLTLNFKIGGIYINPFYGLRAIKASDFLKSNNIYPTRGVVIGYDYHVSRGVSLGIMGIYENPGELGANKTNPEYVKLSSTFSPAITVKYWFW